MTTRLLLFLAASATLFAQATLDLVSAASFRANTPVAPGMIVTAFSPAITANAADWQLLLPGDQPLEPFAAAAGQASFVLPASLTPGATLTLRLRRAGVIAATTNVRVEGVAPGFFTANANGLGAPAGLLVNADRRESLLFEKLTGGNAWYPRPAEVSDNGSYLTLYGTGWRNARRVTATLGGNAVPVAAAVAHPQFAGLDQVNLGPLPAALAGKRGALELVLDADGVASPPVTIALAAPGTAAWGRRPDLIEPNSEMGVAELGGKLYIIGGYPSSRVTVNTVQVYDLATGTWSLTTPLPTGVNHAMPAVHDGKLYVIGGQTDTNTAFVNLVQVYDPATRTWSRAANMPTARGAGAAVVINGKIYVAGGRPPRGSDFAVFDPARNEWQTLPDLPTARNHLAAVAFRNRLYVIGGRFEAGFQSPQTDAVEVYDPATGRWSTGAQMPKPRGGVNAAEAYGCIHVFGGEFATGVHPDHDVYDPVADRWLKLPDMPVGVHGVTGAAFRDGLIYLPGGGTMQGGSSGSLLHQVYRPGLVCAE